MGFRPRASESPMPWTVEFASDFEAEFDALPAGEQITILESLVMLRERGPRLGRPAVDTLKGSAFPNMEELRVQIAGRPWRIIFAFDPARSADPLIGGDKGGGARWYKVNLPVAEARYRRHLDNLKQAP